MPKYYIYLIFAIGFCLILIAIVPKTEIRRLSIHGIIFGGMLDVLVHVFGNVTGLFAWINYGPLGILGLPIFPSISWAIFFIMYFYFIPVIKPLNYVFALVSVFFSVVYFNLMIDLGILKASSRFLVPVMGFAAWFWIATWGFYKLSHYIEVETNLIRAKDPEKGGA